MTANTINLGTFEAELAQGIRHYAAQSAFPLVKACIVIREKTENGERIGLYHEGKGIMAGVVQITNNETIITAPHIAIRELFEKALAETKTMFGI